MGFEGLIPGDESYKSFRILIERWGEGMEDGSTNGKTSKSCDLAVLRVRLASGVFHKKLQAKMKPNTPPVRLYI